MFLGFNIPIEFVKGTHSGLLIGCSAMGKLSLWSVWPKIAHVVAELFETKNNMLGNVNV